MAGQSEYGIIFTYVLFVGLLGFFVTLGAPEILQNAPPAPQPPPMPGSCLLCDFLYPVANIAYFFLLMGITSVTYPWLGLLLTAYTAVFIYMVIRLVRGGG